MNENENIIQFQPETDTLLRETAAFIVEDDKAAETAIRYINGLRDLRRRISEMFASIIAKWKSGLDDTKAKEKEYTEPLRIREEAIQGKVQEFMIRRRREREEAEKKKAQEIAEINRRIEDARIEAAVKAEAEGRKQEAERILEAPLPKASFLSMPTAPPASKTIAGATIRRNWRWRVIDLAKVPDEFKTVMIYVPSVEAVFRRDRENMQIPGIEVYSEETLVRR